LAEPILAESTLVEPILAESSSADRILVIRLGAVGDVVRTLPAFGELRSRFPAAHLAWLVEPKAEAAVRGQPGVDEVIVFPRETLEAKLGARRYLAFVREAVSFAVALRRQRFDLVMDFHAILKSGLLARASGAPLRVGYARPFAREGAALFVNRRARVEPRKLSRFARNAALVDFLGLGDPTAPLAEAGRGRGFAVDPADRLRIRKRLGDGFAPGAPVVVIHPGTSPRTPYKRYPDASWGAVARRLGADGAVCLVAAGGETERELAERVVAASGGHARLAPRTETLGDLAALLEVADLFLGSDSGPLHLASLVGTPVVQLLGPTDPVENRPWPGTPSRSLRVPVGCSPCRRGCGPAPCMQVLPPLAVTEAARELLEESEAREESA
jgi:ADP-heptose:LPS heptosyltransferase